MKIRRTITLALAAVATTALLATGASAHEGHDHGPSTHMAPKGMSVTARVKADPMSGYNLQIITKGFKWAPWAASTKHVQGQGHAHVYVNGKKVARQYGPWLHLTQLVPGRKNFVKVSLNGNDHGEYVRGGKPIQVTSIVNVPAVEEDEGTEMPMGDDASPMPMHMH